jgi:hypothetical protein
MVKFGMVKLTGKEKSEVIDADVWLWVGYCKLMQVVAGSFLLLLRECCWIIGSREGEKKVM